MMLECVINVSEGRDPSVLEVLRTAAGPVLLDVHKDPDHHRAVFTLAGAAADVEDAARRLTVAAVRRLDLGRHAGAHPRRGVVDVVPFVHVGPGADGRLADADIGPARRARDDFARWAAETLALPCFVYGPPPEPSLPD